MNALLERILNIIANDAFPDEDKPYIIREVINTYNDNSKHCYPAGSRVELGWGDGYDCGYSQAKSDIGTLQQRELDEKWDAGYLKGVSDAEAKLAPKHAAEMKVEHDRAFSLGKNAGYEERKKHVQVNQDHFYNKGHAEGYQKGLDEKAMQHVTDIFTVRKESKEEGYQKGYIDGHNYGYDNGHVDGLEKGRSEQDEHLSELQSNWHRRGYNEGIAAGRQEFHRHAAERYRAGVEDSRNEIVGIINNLRTPE